MRWLLPSPHIALFVVGLPSGFALATALAHSVPLNLATRGYHRLVGKRKDDEEVEEERETNPCNDEEAKEETKEEAKEEEGTKFGQFKVFSSSWFRSWCSCLLKSVGAKLRRFLGSSCTGCFVCCGAARCVCFLLVPLTHVELLRYLYLVVVPGEQRRCAVW